MTEKYLKQAKMTEKMPKIGKNEGKSAQNRRKWLGKCQKQAKMTEKTPKIGQNG